MDDAGLQPLIFGLGEWVNVLRVELGWVAWFVRRGEGGGGVVVLVVCFGWGVFIHPFPTCTS